MDSLPGSDNSSQSKWYLRLSALTRHYVHVHTVKNHISNPGSLGNLACAQVHPQGNNVTPSREPRANLSPQTPAPHSWMCGRALARAHTRAFVKSSAVDGDRQGVRPWTSASVEGSWRSEIAPRLLVCLGAVGVLSMRPIRGVRGTCGYASRTWVHTLGDSLSANLHALSD